MYRMASLVEPLVLHRLDSRPHHPPLFVVGAPRTGTTLVYQHLLNRYRFAYVPNLADDHPDAPLLYSLLACLSGSYSPTYNNHYGQTAGCRGASDGWNIFRRWFPIYDLRESTDAAVDRELPPIVRGLEALYGAPFLNKNNHNSVRLTRLVELFPDALFVHVTRDPRDAALSLADARRANDVELGTDWSCPPPQWSNREFSAQLEQAAFTVVGIAAHVRRVLGRMDDSRTAEVAYADFCKRPERLVDWVRRSYRTAGVELEPRATTFRSRLEASVYGAERRARVESWLTEARRLVEDSTAP